MDQRSQRTRAHGPAYGRTASQFAGLRGHRRSPRGTYRRGSLWWTSITLIQDPGVGQADLPNGVTLRDLGEHRLKDLRQPKHLYQLVITGLPSDFPPLKSLGLSTNNLPIQLTSFIGRAKERTDIGQAIREHRLVTLTGPGGSWQNTPGIGNCH